MTKDRKDFPFDLSKKYDLSDPEVVKNIVKNIKERFESPEGRKQFKAAAEKARRSEHKIFKVVEELEEFIDGIEKVESNDLSETIKKSITEEYLKKLKNGFLNEYYNLKTPEEIEKIRKEYLSRVNNIISKKGQEIIDLDTINLIHKAQDGYIAFCRRFNGEHQDLAGVKVSELNKCLPQLMPYLFNDAFFSVNSYYANKKGFINPITNLPNPMRKEKRLKYLNSCYCDLDFYKGGIDYGEAIGNIMRAQDEGIIPTVSLIARSGRGIYLFWLLKHQRKGLQQRARPREIKQYKEINKKIIETLNNYNPKLKADKNAFDAARILRVPGSINTKANKQAVYALQLDAGANVITYTLDELTEDLGLPYIPDLIDVKYSEPQRRIPNNRKGWIKLAKIRIEDFYKIMYDKNGFKRGTRAKSLWIFCHLAIPAGYTLTELKKACIEIADYCRPPYPSDPDDKPIDKIISQVLDEGNQKFSSNYLANYFRVDPETAERLDLTSIILDTVREERDRKAKEKARCIPTARRKELKDIVDKKKGNIPSLRDLAELLKHRGFDVSHETVRADLKRIYPDLYK